MDAVDRMFHVLVSALRSQQPPADGKAFSAAELHDRILPYRHFRRELNLETNREYELTLMQLLSGARGYLDVDERLRDVLGKELATAAPDPARLRDVADAECQVSPNKKALVPVARLSGPLRAERSSCAYCGGTLPLGRASHYCPHCGQNLLVATCLACGAEVEADWRYCVACGKAAPEAAS
ncbi:MAG: zinc ribbon domain-containing protein [Gemmatimonadota bacterium]